MQRVFRFSLVGILGIASLTACGDKVNPNVTTPIDSTIHSVTVTPASAPMNIGDKLQFVASVQAGSAAKDKTVAWTSSNSSVASVDGTGLVTAKLAGVTSIIATANADHSQAAAATVTVGAGAITTVTVSSITQTTAAGTVNANLGNVVGQLDVTLNVDAGTAKLNEVDLVMNCTGPGNSGQDTIVAKQTLATGDVAPLAADAASENAAPITLSVNTASFNSTSGAVAFRNGTCTIKGKAITQAGTPPVLSTTTSTGLSAVLNNGDVLVGSVASSATATAQTGLSWVGGNQTVTVIPVFYTPSRTAVSTTVTLSGLVATGTVFSKQQTVANTGGAAITATFSDGNGATPGGATDIDQVTNSAATATATVIDNNGQSFGNATSITFLTSNGLATAASVLAAAPVAIPALRLDTQKPAPGTFSVTNNPDQNIIAGSGYVGTAFKFAADSASGYRGPDAVAGNQTQNLDNGGVDKIVVTFQFRNNGSGSYTTVTNTTPINESVTSTAYQLRMITADALGNADTVSNASALIFGVDKTAPAITLGTNPKNGATTTVASGLGAFSVTVSDNLSGPGSSLVAQTRNWNGLNTVSSSNEGRVNTNLVFPGATGIGTSATATQQPCYIGRFNATAAASGPNAIALFNRDGTAIGFCTPVPYNVNALNATQGTSGYWATTIVAADVAANQAAPVTRTVLEAQAGNSTPVVQNIGVPATAVGNSTVSFPATVTDSTPAGVGDITSSWITLAFGNGNLFRYPAIAGPGTAFDNVLTRGSPAPVQVTPSIPNFVKNLQPNGGVAVAAPALVDNASAVTVAAQDSAHNIGSLNYVFVTGAPQLVAGSTAVLATNFSGGWTITADTGKVSDCAGCATPANPLSAVLKATAKGTTATFVNPFAGGQVSFWYRVNGSGTPWFFIGNAGAGSARDDGINRFWDYTFTFTPPTVTPDGTVLTGGALLDVIAVGVNTAGDGVMTTVIQPILLTNP